MSSPQSNWTEMLAPLAEDHDWILRTRLMVESASSAGRVISSSTCAGSELGYGMLISSPGKSTSGRNASGSRVAAMPPIAVTETSTMVAVTG